MYFKIYFVPLKLQNQNFDMIFRRSWYKILLLLCRNVYDKGTNSIELNASLF